LKAGSKLPGEFELIARYFAPLSRGFPGAYGLQDDAAVVTPTPGRQIVVKTDAIVAGVHFLPDDPAGLVARKALRVNLSDLAAKGAVPLCYMLDLILPPMATEEWVADFAGGLACDQEAFGVHLIGGDTNTTPGPLTIAVMALGEIGHDQILRRGGARPGDVIFVTGTIGDAALGLAALNGTLPDIDPETAAPLIDRYRLPAPRVDVGPRLRCPARMLWSRQRASRCRPRHGVPSAMTGRGWRRYLRVATTTKFCSRRPLKRRRGSKGSHERRAFRSRRLVICAPGDREAGTLSECSMRRATRSGWRAGAGRISDLSARLRGCRELTWRKVQRIALG